MAFSIDAILRIRGILSRMEFLFQLLKPTIPLIAFGLTMNLEYL